MITFDIHFTYIKLAFNESMDDAFKSEFSCIFLAILYVEYGVLFLFNWQSN